MNVALALALSAGVDVTFMSAAMLACKRCGVRTQIVTPLSIAVLSVCWLVQSTFSTQVTSFWESVLLVVVTGCVAVSAVTDAGTGYIFDLVTLPGFGVALLIGAITGSLVPIGEGMLLVSGAIALLHVASRGRGIGLGDAKLAACIGALLGARNGLRALAFAFVLGGLYAAAQLLSRRARGKHSVPFAPYLAAGVFIELALRAA